MCSTVVLLGFALTSHYLKHTGHTWSAFLDFTLLFFSSLLLFEMWNIYDLKGSTQIQSGNGRCPWTSACCSILCYPPTPTPTYPLCARTITAFRSEGGLTVGLTLGSGYLSKHCYNKIWRKFSYMTTVHLSVFFSVLLTCLQTLIVKQ